MTVASVSFPFLNYPNERISLPNNKVFNAANVADESCGSITECDIDDTQPDQWGRRNYICQLVAANTQALTVQGTNPNQFNNYYRPETGQRSYYYSKIMSELPSHTGSTSSTTCSSTTTTQSTTPSASLDTLTPEA